MNYNDLDQFTNLIVYCNPKKSNVFKVLELNVINEEKYNNNENYFCIIPYSSKKIKYSLYKIISEKKIVFEKESQNTFKTIELKPSTTRINYINNLVKLKEQIQQGNIYEINYCIEFYANEVEINPFLVYNKLNALAKAPYSSFVKLGDEFIISASPELFLKREGNKLYTKPIKGTAKRGATDIEDKELKSNLFNSIKERTENVMAVDVARNDLSVIAKRGTVHVNKLYNIESYETVHQMVSTVSCEIEETTDFEKIISATFPMASMTGAPKISAMKLIDEYENFERNFYSGAMGIVEKNGDFELSVNIRSIFYNQKSKRLSIAVGSAVTHLCEPEKEYEECLLKANALLKALNAHIEIK